MSKYLLSCIIALLNFCQFIKYLFCVFQVTNIRNKNIIEKIILEKKIIVISNKWKGYLRHL